jgi:hypothetical protein
LCNKVTAQAVGSSGVKGVNTSGAKQTAAVTSGQKKPRSAFEMGLQAVQAGGLQAGAGAGALQTNRIGFGPLAAGAAGGGNMGGMVTTMVGSGVGLLKEFNKKISIGISLVKI